MNWGLRNRLDTGDVHKLRHTFASHLVMKGALAEGRKK